MSVQNKINEVWRTAVSPYVKVSGIWKVAKSAFIKIEGKWRSWFLQGGLNDEYFMSTLGTGFNGQASCATLASDGKIIVGGDFTSFNGVTTNRIAQLNSDGALDTAFTSTVGGGFNNSVRSIAIQSDGKIIAVGNFQSFNGTAAKGIARLNPDGSLDTEFTVNSGIGFTFGDFPTNFGADLSSVQIQPDGVIVVGGVFTYFNGVEVRTVAKISSDGFLDTDFAASIGSGPSSGFRINALKLQSDGKIVIGGNFASFNDIPVNAHLARLNPDGSLDTAFNDSTSSKFNNGEVEAIAIQSDGKIIVGGTFSRFNGSTVWAGLIRINIDGTWDSSFVTFFNVIGPPRSIFEQSDGKIVVGGEMSNQSFSNHRGIMRFNTNGSRDTFFITNTNSGVNVGGRVYGVAEQQDKKVVCVGSFTSIAGVSANRIARIGGEIAY
jgi:uncharacterized delta-60 repeat protein